MNCNGNFHAEDCKCGFGGIYNKSGIRKPVGWGIDLEQPDCFTRPPSECSSCGQQVYYYQNSAGSKVLFDKLGHPWPKHDCATDEKKVVQPEKNILDFKIVEVRKMKGDLYSVVIESAAHGRRLASVRMEARNAKAAKRSDFCFFWPDGLGRSKEPTVEFFDLETERPITFQFGKK